MPTALIIALLMPGPNSQHNSLLFGTLIEKYGPEVFPNYDLKFLTAAEEEFDDAGGTNSVNSDDVVEGADGRRVETRVIGHLHPYSNSTVFFNIS
ncbi:hypothetical protein B0H14DRAFT_3426557 [Mycena olivaceomarginata]|nr:hypothetical protein B0H14DRAFT_3426557 [Mycena olivaceomarginata]